jgi:hypothetical protein
VLRRRENCLGRQLGPALTRKEPAMPDHPALTVPAEQRALLRDALADAVYYRDPPVACDACEALDGLCDECAAGLARARAYLDLGDELGLELSA